MIGRSDDEYVPFFKNAIPPLTFFQEVCTKIKKDFKRDFKP